MLSKKAQYAFKALMYMAEKKDNQPVLIAEIAKKKRIPLKFLENILLELKKAGVLESKKGKGGGYFFKASPKDISLAKIVRLIDGPIAMLPCDEKQCGLHDMMILVRDANLKILEKKTVADLSKRTLV
jgi:Rrf2 family protein